MNDDKNKLIANATDYCQALDAVNREMKGNDQEVTIGLMMFFTSIHKAAPHLMPIVIGAWQKFASLHLDAPLPLAPAPVAGASIKVYLLEADFFLVPGRKQSLHTDMASLNVAAAELANLLLQEVELEDDATPEDWQAKCLQARYARAVSTGRRVDDLNGGHVRFTEMELDLPAPPPPQSQLRVTGFRGNPLRVVLSSGQEATVTQKLIDTFASPSPFDHVAGISLAEGEVKALLYGQPMAAFTAAMTKLANWLVESGGDDSHASDPLLTADEQKSQGQRCSCLGVDDYCPCQNVPDAETRRARALVATATEAGR
ncbi:Hypothetical protein NGAL_HAMBI2605_59480 [Neorhizobium galegae bv. orientalis]|nr:Hypothetical protein NGAL_HAMBI2605_59480 [Neorhizobium galegae bv. orientalis]